jgi:hypothetical protein
MPVVSAPQGGPSTNLPPSKDQSIRARLVENGSAFSYSNGADINPNLLSTKQSPLHYNASKDQPGYSVTGEQFSEVNEAMNAYQDGEISPLPLPSQLDVNDPVTADPAYKLKYTSTPGNGYKNQISSLVQ